MATEELVLADDGVRLWTSRGGDGPPLLLCHGGPGSWDQLEPVAAMIDDLASVVRWDQRGAGRSQPVGPYTVARFVADIECVRSHLALDRWIVGGHSWGAGLALRYALAHPHRTAALVYLSGTDLHWSVHREAYHAERLRRLGPYRTRWEELRATTDSSASEERELRLLTSSTDFADRTRALELAERWDDDRFPVNYDCNAAIAADKSENEDDDELLSACRQLGVPALVVHGTRDPRPIDGPAELATVLPDARLVRLPDVGHIPWAEHPDLLRDALRSFLTSVRADRTR